MYIFIYIKILMCATHTHADTYTDTHTDTLTDTHTHTHLRIHILSTKITQSINYEKSMKNVVPLFELSTP
jgi:hypothetical protein